MNRNGQCWPLRPLFLMLLLLLIQVVLCEDQMPTTSDKVDSDVAGIRTFFDDIFSSEAHDGQRGNALRDGRTFGQKRIQFMMMPMIYKMGVMMTMLMVLTVISLKGLIIGLILLVLKLSAIFGKFYATFHGHGHSAWAPPPPIHVHVHGEPIQTHHPSSSHSQAYSGWEDNGGGPPDESYYYKG